MSTVLEEFCLHYIGNSGLMLGGEYQVFETKIGASQEIILLCNKVDVVVQTLLHLTQTQFTLCLSLIHSRSILLRIYTMPHQTKIFH